MKKPKKNATKKRSPVLATATLVDENTTLQPFDEEEPRRLTNTQVDTILAHYFYNFVPPDSQDESTYLIRRNIADTSYLTVSPVWVRNVILADPVLAPARYKYDLFDCDDYVQYLKVRMAMFAAAKQFPAPIALGYLLTKEHAFNFCISHERALWLINTQSDDKPMTDNPETFVEFLRLRASNPLLTIYI
jgi:hypothetical protein